MKHFWRLLIIFLVSSCSSVPDNNKDFEEKYRKSVEGIQLERKEPEERRLATLVPATKSGDWRDPNFDPSSVAKLDGKKPPQMFVQEAQRAGEKIYVGEKIPDDMFEISYNLKNHPQYRKIGVEFDGIEIPDADFYQVKTESSDKSYLIADGDGIGNNIVESRKSRSNQDINNSEIIIAEYKEKTREQKMLQNFDVVVAKVEKKAVKKSKVSKAKKSSVNKKNAPQAASLRAKNPF